MGAEQLHVTVDHQQCQGVGYCERIAPHVFRLGDDALSHVIDSHPPDSEARRRRRSRHTLPQPRHPLLTASRIGGQAMSTIPLPVELVAQRHLRKLIQYENVRLMAFQSITAGYVSLIERENVV